MTTTIKDRLTTVTFKDGTCTKEEMYIGGQTLEEYFSSAGLQVDVPGYSLVSDGKRLDRKDTLRPGAIVTRAKNLRNG